MDRPTIDDREFGKGRQYNSSSSRESSPRRPPKRSFSPPSDDDANLKTVPIEDDDTPPPPDRSFLRQPLAFGQSVLGSSAVPIDTYQADLPKRVGRPRKNIFMRIDNGDQSAPTYASTKTKSTKKRRTNDYGGQASRFRLAKESKVGKGTKTVSGYNPTTVHPPATSYHQSAFYASVSPTPTLSSSYYPSSTTAGSSSVSPHFTSTLPPALQPSLLLPVLQKGKEREIFKNGTPNAHHQYDSYALSSVATPAPQSSPEASPARSPPLCKNPGNYYRRDYDKDREVQSSRKRDNYRDQSSRASTKPSLNQSQSSRSEKPHRSAQSSVQSAARHTTRMVTLLIEDHRFGKPDKQLTEVRVPLRPIEGSDGYWADARLLSEQLQNGPSRIDGPARMYTFRGSYRQIFLRVTADNEDEFMPMNLLIEPKRILSCLVEALPVPGTAPVAPYLPGTSSPEADSSSQEMSPPRRNPLKEERRRGPEYAGPPKSELSAILGTPPGAFSQPNPKDQLGTTSSPYSALSSGYPSDDEEKSEGELASDHMVGEIECYISEFPDWHDFFQAKAQRLPHRVCDTLVQFKFVKKCWDNIVGTKLPSVSLPIEKKHILQALRIDDPEFERICTETMALLELYGPGGKRLQDETTSNMMADKSQPAYGSKPSKKLLHHLQDLDKKWKAGHPDTN